MSGEKEIRWCVKEPNGVRWLSALQPSEAHAWDYLSDTFGDYPEGDIEEAKRLGYSVVRVEVREVEEKVNGR